LRTANRRLIEASAPTNNQAETKTMLGWGIPVRAGLAAAVVLAFAGGAVAETVTFKAALAAGNEVPPGNSRAVGSADVTYDTQTRQLGWTIVHSGLSSPGTAAHFHGPAGPGQNAPPIITIGGPLTSPIKGNAILDAAQWQDLQAGRWYINIHTPAFPGGEVRGQVLKAP
jgi:hypothetical protein